MSGTTLRGVGTGPKATSAPGLLGFARSTLGAKAIVAVTGLLLVGFVVQHLAGNLLIYAGPEATNAYAATLKGSGALLWVARGGLLVCFLVHIGAALRLAQLNSAARPERYVYEDTIQASWASRHMVLTGLLVLAFVAYHLAHFTLGVTNPDYLGFEDPMKRHDVYRMVVTGFKAPAVSGTYIAAMILVALHISHGFGSLWRTLGVSDSRLQRGLHKLGWALAVGIWLGFVSIPITILAGVIK